MEEGGGGVQVPNPGTMAPLWVHFGFRLNDKGEPSNVAEAICKVFCKKSQSKGNATNVKQTHNP